MDPQVSEYAINALGEAARELFGYQKLHSVTTITKACDYCNGSGKNRVFLGHVFPIMGEEEESARPRVAKRVRPVVEADPDCKNCKGSGVIDLTITISASKKPGEKNG